FIFGYIGYDMKNAFEKLESKNQDSKLFPEAYLWVPDCVLKIQSENFEFLQGEKKQEHFAFLNYFLEEETDQNFHPYEFNFVPTTSKEKYLETVLKLKEHIQLGDIYEINYCQEMVAENVKINFSLDAYFKMNKITKAPFSSFFQFDEFSLFCGSPERYIRKQGTELISQPIKGTAARSQNIDEDLSFIKALKNDPKEQAENIMIVDLVRNDLSRIADKNSVVVTELMGVHSFETVHQLISTVKCTIPEQTSFLDVLKVSFPMGSMTGAPKIKAMELIEKYEDFKRGIYSGTVGYITPNGDFDFNVVIRSLFYNKKLERLTCAVGGAITIHSDPEKEYLECKTKIQRILDGMNE
ncbi:MAG: anthranilate synthase component I family protein, partial [Bacteroidetes bacterium]|nr:anthranilate synthase component I family protein [Bacteroidota bacterium]